MQYFSEENIQKFKKILKVKEVPGNQEIFLWEKVAKFTPYFSKIPWIEAICVCNSLAMNAAHKDSDIDLFIICKAQRLWTARFFLTLFLWLLGERKTKRKHAGKFCLSFFITPKAWDFSKIALDRDIYLAYWIQSLVPILNRWHSFEKFIAQNAWYTFQWYENISETYAPYKNIESSQKRSYMGNIWEKFLKKVWFYKSQKSFQKLWKPYGIIISDTILKFHNTDRRKEISAQIFQDEQ